MGACGDLLTQVEVAFHSSVLPREMCRPPTWAGEVAGHLGNAPG